MRSGDEIHEERIGSLLVKSASGAGADASYRDADLAPRLEITREDSTVEGGSFRSPLALALTVLLAVGLLAFAVIVRSGPAIGTISVAVAALAWLVLRGGRRSTGRTRLTVSDGELRVRAPDHQLRLAAADVSGLGIGENLPCSTVFARVEGGRLLLMDGLTAEEADAAAARIAEALGRGA